MHRLVDAIQMDTQNICFHKKKKKKNQEKRKNQKKKKKKNNVEIKPLDKSHADLL